MVRVLVVEPEREIAAVLEDALDAKMSTVVSAPHRREAEQQMRLKGPFEVVVISLALGEAQALGLVEEARPQSPDSVIVCVLDEVTDELEGAARLRGATRCIPRSEDYQDLLQILWQVERRRAAREARERANEKRHGRAQTRGRGGAR